MKRTVVIGLGVGAVLFTAGRAAAQPARDEQFGMPPAPDRPRLYSPAFNAGGPESASIVQVNIGPGGLNIVGDAANEPSLAVDPLAPNRIAVGWRQFDSIASNFREAGNAYSRDGGRTWTNRPAIENGLFRSDPVLEADSAGNFHYLSLLGDGNWLCQVFRSGDGGATYPVRSEARGGDKAWFTIDASGGVGDGHQYEAWSTCCGPYSGTTFSRSTNGGLTWMTPMTIPNSPVWGTLAVGPDGELYVAGTQYTSGVYWVDKSLNAKNAGATPTFTSATLSLGGGLGFSAGPNPAGLLGQVWVDVDRSGGPRRGWVYVLASVDPSGPDPLDVMFSRSTDAGQTWSNPTRVNADPPGANNWQWFGTMAVAPDGRIDVVWNSTHESGTANMSRLFSSSSGDGGATWSAPEPIGAVWNSHVGWPQQNKIGDYYDMVSDRVGAHVAWSATLNGEQDVYYTRVNDYDCNANGVGDSLDLSNGPARDCNRNGIPDSCDIAAGVSADANHDGWPDDCCTGDYDSDGFITGDDFSAFVTDFEGGNLRADMDGDGFLTGDDFSVFVTAFEQGC